MANKKTLIWFHSHFLYWMGGTKYIYELLRRLKESYDVVVVVENASDYASGIYRQAGIKLISLNKLSSTSIFYWLTLPYQVVDTIRRIKQQVVFRKNAVLVSSMFPMNLVLSRLKRPFYQLCFEPFAFFHDPDFVRGFVWYKRLAIMLLSYLYRSWDITATKMAKSIITLNQTTEKIIRQVYGMSSNPIYTGIDTVHFHPYVSPAILAKYKDYQVIIHSTDYTPVKGTDRMLKLFAKVHARLPRTRLLITTTIPKSSVLKNYQELALHLGITQDVEFLGFVDYDVLPQLYSLAKVLVQCSYSEMSGTTSMALPVKEALACGTPCIRSPITTEDVVDGVTGYLVDPRDESKMLDRIIKLVNLSESKRHSLAQKARASITSQFSWDKTVDRLTRIINSV